MFARVAVLVHVAVCLAAAEATQQRCMTLDQSTKEVFKFKLTQVR